MTSPDAERPDGASLPEHEQRAWDAIVADLSGQIDLGPDFPADPPPAETVDPSPEAYAPRIIRPPVPVDPLAPLDTTGEDDEDEDEAGFEPPPPPPIPRPTDAIARFSWAAVIAGPILVVLGTVLGFDRWMINLGVVLTVGGFVALVWRAKEREDDDDGAVL